jgi:membrane fusion protein (multidrug efflux system)
MRVRAAEQSPSANSTANANADGGAAAVPAVALEGTISAIDPTIDPSTRSVKIRAAFPAAKIGELRPGMFMRAYVILPQSHSVVAVPLTAVVHASYGDSVFVAVDKTLASGKPGKVAQQKFVRLGESRGDYVAVLDGLSAGEEVVTAGAFKLRNEIPLLIDNEHAKLDPKLAPTPPNR